MRNRGASDLELLPVKAEKSAKLICEIEGIQDINHLPQLPPALLATITTRMVGYEVDCGRGEVAGVHSFKILVESIVEYLSMHSIISRTCHFNWHMSPQIAAKIHANRPEIFCGASNTCVDIDFILEIKPRHLFEESIRQAAKYTLEVIKETIETCRSLAQCYSTDAISLPVMECTWQLGKF